MGELAYLSATYLLIARDEGEMLSVLLLSILFACCLCLHSQDDLCKQELPGTLQYNLLEGLASWECLKLTHFPLWQTVRIPANEITTKRYKFL